MSFAQTVLLGALAGFTIFLGLPAGRLRLLSDRSRVGLAMFSVGILAFIFVDVLEHGLGIIDGALESFKDGGGSFGHLAVLTGLLIAGFGLGSAGLGIIERRLRPRTRSYPPVAGGSTAEAFTIDEAAQLASEADLARRRALQTGVVIAVAIGVSARSGAVSLATVLIIGFALHNATEGFGIIGPLGSVTPSWRWLGLVGLIGGGPTFLGAIVGYQVTSEPLELAFYAVAGGAILYVIGEVWQAMRRLGHRELGLWLLSVGFMAGVITDLVVAYGGG